MTPFLDPAPPWVAPLSQYVVLYHGTTLRVAKSIANNGIDLSFCSPDTDFGRGFYLTTIARQARHWAWIRYYSTPIPQSGDQPGVLWLRLPRDVLAQMASLAFVVGDYSCEDYWSLVQHCRQSASAAANDHQRPGWYDMVSGPVAAFWEQRALIAGADQFSFHSDAAVAELNKALSGKPGLDYDCDPV